MDESKIARINELYHKSKEVGLSDAELKEQLILRKEYIDSVRRNLRGQLDNISVKEADGYRFIEERAENQLLTVNSVNLSCSSVTLYS